MLVRSTVPPKKCLTTTEKFGRTVSLGITPDALGFFNVITWLWWLVNFKLINYNFFFSTLKDSQFFCYFLFPSVPSF